MLGAKRLPLFTIRLVEGVGREAGLDYPRLFPTALPFRHEVSAQRAAVAAGCIKMRAVL